MKWEKNINLILLVVLMSFGMFVSIPIAADLQTNQVINQNEPQNTVLSNIETPKSSFIGSNEFPWWNESYLFRIRVQVSFPANQRNAPVELYINFTKYLESIGEHSKNFNDTDIRVIEQDTAGSFKEIEDQFVKAPSTFYNPLTNASGELLWVISGTVYGGSPPKDYFIYFCNGEFYRDGITRIESPNYPILRIFGEDFEYGMPNLSSFGGSNDADPTLNDINHTTAAHGNSSITFWGNEWKIQAMPSYTRLDNQNLTMIYAVYIDDPINKPEITGMGIVQTPTAQFLSRHTYVVWGDEINYDSAQYNVTYKTGINPYQWTYQTCYISADSQRGNLFSWQGFYYIHYACDDDSSPPHAYISFDDISIWRVPVYQPRTGQIIVNTYDISRVSGQLPIKVVDVDGFPIPNANITIGSSIKPYLNTSELTNDDGIALFTNITLYDTYNITVTYKTEGLGTQNSVFQIGSINNFVYDNYEKSIDLKCDIWSMEFHAVTYHGDPINHGYVVLNNTANTETYAIKPFTDGRCIIRYKNSSAYNYFVYYNYSSISPDYNYTQPQQLLVSSTITRQSASNFQSDTYDYTAELDFTTVGDGSNDLEVTYTNTSFLDNSAITNVAISFINFTQNITEYKIWGKNSRDTNFENEDLIYSENLGVYSPNITLNLLNETYYGLKVYCRKDNSTNSDKNGTMSFTFNYRSTENMILNISSVTLNVTYLNPEITPLVSAIVEIYKSSQHIADLFLSNGTCEFTYLRLTPASYGNYTLFVKFFGNRKEINKTVYNGGISDWYGADEGRNFTLDQPYQLDIIVNINVLYKTALNITYPGYNIETTYGNQVWIGIYYNITENGVEIPTPLNPDSCTYIIVDEDYTLLDNGDLVKDTANGTGYYYLSFNSNEFPAKSGYTIIISAHKVGYTDPTDLYLTLTINKIPASVDIYEKTDMQLSIITNKDVSKYWEQTFNITVNYHTLNDNLTNALIMIDWEDGSTIPLNPDYQLGDGYYTYELNTSDFSKMGTYIIHIYASKGNYSEDTSKYIQLHILPIPTKIAELDTPNSVTSALLRMSITLNVTDARNFTFTYTDIYDNSIENAYLADYSWDRYNSTGSLMSSGAGSLKNESNGIYILDFDTANRVVGDYIILVNLQKENYEDRQAMILLNVRNREINIDAVGDFISGNVFRMERLTDQLFNVSVKLTDLSRNNIPLHGASVYLSIEGWSDPITLKEVNNSGIYTAIIDMSQRGINAFFKPITLTGKLSYSANTFNSGSESVTIIVGMKEIFPGVPMFYFILGVVIGAMFVIGIVVYQIAQYARIPEFVKKVNRELKNIRRKRKVNPNNLVTDTREEYLEKIFSRDWEYLGLDFRKSLEIEQKKKIKPGKKPKILSKYQEPEKIIDWEGKKIQKTRKGPSESLGGTGPSKVNSKEDS